ncbi:nickel pincer cofactor biosynthesis protein LarC [Alkalibacter rhizosphaerae]|uniref:Pyridinium-3,5-bisthiocarboxylic acid mononucleotide nickel insertion protein n=1 Tax=Alkalibacter rhizosphaerae TaxID=2815577 RepID=A0A974XI14_9FIRM|nr:nickel pincer cofactor biosynthesis protein LarC [Alkalibacter rhizosphaerae]QSX09120.1 nickel pincer cofactor biosynthesis protein LarC [Alkalibacter rhizosphaerae]
MRIIYYDCFSGISGDMNLGAMVDLGMDGEYLVGELNKLSIRDSFHVWFEKQQKHGITGTKAHVDQLKHEHAHRHLLDIEEIIDDSTLNQRVRETAKGMFRLLAEAEGKVHGKTPEAIHFHEVGAVDSIVDIVGAAICFDYWNVDQVLASPVQVGGGFVQCAHGLMPVPAPATAALLEGIPIRSGLVDGETTTPTGAVILAYGADRFVDSLQMDVKGVGYGLGTKDFQIPNVLRVYLAEVEEGVQEEAQLMIEANLDDMNPEYYSFVEERLFDAGALDVFKTPIIMKKGRPGVKLSVLCETSNKDIMTELIFTHTTTLGVRTYPVGKVMMERKMIQAETIWGRVDVKVGIYKGKPIKHKPEYEQCAAIAKENNLDLIRVYDEVNKQLEGKYDRTK